MRAIGHKIRYDVWCQVWIDRLRHEDLVQASFFRLWAIEALTTRLLEAMSTQFHRRMQ